MTLKEKYSQFISNQLEVSLEESIAFGILTSINGLRLHGEDWLALSSEEMLEKWVDIIKHNINKGWIAVEADKKPIDGQLVEAMFVNNEMVYSGEFNLGFQDKGFFTLSDGRFSSGSSAVRFNKLKCWRPINQGRVLIRFSEADQPVLCEHANEVPGECNCPPNCYCKSHTCKKT